VEKNWWRSPMFMPWGKHKGKELATLPSGYLRWLAENVAESEPRNKAICLAADKEYQHRERYGCHFEEEKEPESMMIKCPHCGGMVRV